METCPVDDEIVPEDDVVDEVIVPEDDVVEVELSMSTSTSYAAGTPRTARG